VEAVTPEARIRALEAKMIVTAAVMDTLAHVARQGTPPSPEQLSDLAVELRRAANPTTEGDDPMSRRQWTVTVRYTQEKEITVWAEDEDSACEKAVEIVENWNGVISAEADDAEEV
jgi:hypothetical protein